MSHLIFGITWHPGFKLMMEPLSEEEARAAYEAGTEVTIACGADELMPEDLADLEFTGDQPAEWSLYTELTRSTRDDENHDVAVLDFYDVWGTRVLTYYFDRQPDGRLFLANAAEYEFTDATQQHDEYDWTVMTEHLFRTDGYSSITVHRLLPDGSTDVTMTEYSGGDFSTHWEPVPAWGQWDSITRRHRT